MNIAQITGLILAGGRGSRMGGIDKGLQPLLGRPLAEHAIERLRPQVGSLIVNANQNLERYRAFGYPVYPDTISGFAGPLAGLQAGLAQCGTPYLVTVPCDSPFLPPDLVERLAGALEDADAQLAVAVTTEDGRRQPQPVFCMMQSGLLPALESYLQQGGRKIDAWYRSLNMVEVDFADETAFRNINTLEELGRHDRNEGAGGVA